jgi:hypothetical protein
VPHRLVTVGYLGVVLGGAFALNHASEQRSEQKLRTLERACLRQGNPGRALDRLVATGYVRVLQQDLQPIVDCHATYFERDGQPVPLTANQQTLYVELVRRGIVPVIRADGTVAPR